MDYTVIMLIVIVIQNFILNLQIQELKNKIPEDTMAKFHEDKIAFHQKQYQTAFDDNKDKAAAYHKGELENYQKMLALSNNK